MAGDIGVTDHFFKKGERINFKKAKIEHSQATVEYTCEKCGLVFVHFYNRQRNIAKAMGMSGVTLHCSGKKQ